MSETKPMRRRGSALVLTITCVMIMCTFMVLLVQSATMTSSENSRALQGVRLLEAAESGIGLTMPRVATVPPDCSTQAYVLVAAGGKINVSVTVTPYDNAGNVTTPSAATVLRILSTAQVVGPGALAERRAIEVYCKAAIHRSFYKALYVGNRTGVNPYTMTLGPAGGSPRVRPNPPPSPNPNWQTAAQTTNPAADYVEGDVQINGNLAITGATNVFGNVSATGTISGQLITGVATPFADSLPPPDLAAEDYLNLADLVVSPSSKAANATLTVDNPGGLPVGNGTDGNLPPFIFRESYKATNGTGGQSNVFGPQDANRDRHNFMLGSRDGKIRVPAQYSGKAIYVKGNLWLSSDQILQFTLTNAQGGASASGTVLTIVVEGNLYLGDNLVYGNAARDGLLFICKGNVANPQSYTDNDLNYAYGAATDTVLNGTAPYTGPREGQGNVIFADPRFGTGGITNAYVYAENNVYLTNPPQNVSAPSGQDAIFGVNGFLNAGNLFLAAGRAPGSHYNNYRVKYDDRLRQGTLSFKGAPRPSSTSAPMLVVSWREVAR